MLGVLGSDEGCWLTTPGSCPTPRHMTEYPHYQQGLDLPALRCRHCWGQDLQAAVPGYTFCPKSRLQIPRRLELQEIATAFY